MTEEERPLVLGDGENTLEFQRTRDDDQLIAVVRLREEVLRVFAFAM